MSAVVAVVLAGVAGALLAGGPASVPRQLADRIRPAGAFLAAVGTGLGATIVLLHGTELALALMGGALTAAVADELRRRRRSAQAEQRADQVLATCDGLASDLLAGQPPTTALAAAARDWPELGPVAAAAELGADVPAALRELAALPGAAQLRLVAAAWQVAHRSGAGLAGALGMAADQLRSDRTTARVVATELAAAQATARLLAVLPVGVLLLGSGLGGDPVGFLLGSPAGLVCLAIGLALAWAGLRWLARIGDQVNGRRSR